MIRLVILLLLAAAPAFAAPPAHLQKECDAARASKPAQTPAAALRSTSTLTFRVSKSSEPIKTIRLRRIVQCGYKSGVLANALESIYLEVATKDRGDVQFDTKMPGQSKRYFAECEGGLRAALPDLKKGFSVASPKGFTLPCHHRIYRTDGKEPDRVTGAYTYKPQQAKLDVLDLTADAIKIAIDVTVENKFEIMRLQAQAEGPIANSVQVWDCAPPKPGTRPELPPPCH
jgi:hypothetical protein